MRPKAVTAARRSAQLLATADPAKGEALFAKCMSCHTIDAGGANGIGPNLPRRDGRRHRHRPCRLRLLGRLEVASGGEWTFDNMDHWLKSPRGFADGTKMSFAGLDDAEDRAHVIAYLNSAGFEPAAPGGRGQACGGRSSRWSEEAAGEEAEAETVAVDEATPPPPSKFPEGPLALPLEPLSDDVPFRRALAARRGLGVLHLSRNAA